MRVEKPLERPHGSLSRRGVAEARVKDLVARRERAPVAAGWSRQRARRSPRRRGARLADALAVPRACVASDEPACVRPWVVWPDIVLASRGRSVVAGEHAPAMILEDGCESFDPHDCRCIELAEGIERNRRQIEPTQNRRDETGWERCAAGDRSPWLARERWRSSPWKTFPWAPPGVAP